MRRRPMPSFPCEPSFRHRFAVVTLPLLVALATAVGAQSTATPEPAAPPAPRTAPLADLDATMRAAMAAWAVPGASVAIVKDDKLVLARGYGVREVGKADAVDENTRFAIASNSKAFAAALLGMLVDEKKLAWDTPVADVLPWFQMHDPFVTRDLRVEDLLCHRSGLPTFGGDHLWIASSLTAREILERVRHLEPTAPFRARFQYQNLMFVAAGELVPALTKIPYRDFLRTRLFEPLGMTASRSTTEGLDREPNVAWPHEVRGGEVTRVRYDRVAEIAAAAGIVSNVVDVAKWMRLNLAFGAFEGKRLVSERVMRTMQRVHMPLGVSAQARRDGTNFAGYGLGWGLRDYRGRKVVQHGGGLTGMISRVTLVPSEKLGIVILTNHAPNSLPRAMSNWILDRMLPLASADASRDASGARAPKDWVAFFKAREAQAEARRAARRETLAKARIPSTATRAPLAAYVGAYANPLSGEANVSLRDGALWFRYDDRHEGPLEHWHHDTFRIRWTDPIFDMPKEALLTFGFQEDGNVAKLWTTFYHKIRFDRVKDDATK